MPDYRRECGVPVQRKDWTQEEIEQVRGRASKDKTPKWVKVAYQMLVQSNRPWKVWTKGSRKSISVYLFAQEGEIITCCRISNHPRWSTRTQRGSHHFFDGSDMTPGAIYKRFKRLSDSAPSGPLTTIKRYTKDGNPLLD